MAPNNSSSSRSNVNNRPAIPPPPPPPVMNQLDVDSLRQGQLYLIRGRMVKLALFEGWNDDACLVFSVLREEMKPMSWSEVKYMAGDFDAFEAFDSDGNPPIYVWKRALGTELPYHWFRMFEEARRRQSDWMAVYGDESAENELSARPITLGGTANNDVVDAQAIRDDAASPMADRDNLRAFIMGSATEPASGSVNSTNDKFNTAERRAEETNKSTKGGKKTRKALGGLFS